jgi:hypothetical protein
VALTGADIGLAVLTFGVCFIASFVASRGKLAQDRLRSALFWGLLFSAAQLTRAAFDIEFGPPVSTILAIATVLIVLAAIVSSLRESLVDDGKPPRANG